MDNTIKIFKSIKDSVIEYAEDDLLIEFLKDNEFAEFFKSWVDGDKLKLK